MLWQYLQFFEFSKKLRIGKPWDVGEVAPPYFGLDRSRSEIDKNPEKISRPK